MILVSYLDNSSMINRTCLIHSICKHLYIIHNNNNSCMKYGVCKTLVCYIHDLCIIKIYFVFYSCNFYLLSDK